MNVSSTNRTYQDKIPLTIESASYRNHPHFTKTEFNLLIMGLLLVFVTACGPYKETTLHIASILDTNQGRALPIVVIPIDDSVRQFLLIQPVEELFISPKVEQLLGKQFITLRPRQRERVPLILKRSNGVNDFLIVTDYYQIYSPDQQKILLGSDYYSKRNIYLVAMKDRITLVSRGEFEKLTRPLERR